VPEDGAWIAGAAADIEPTATGTYGDPFQKLDSDTPAPAADDAS
jgi:hypothetical protein